MTRSGIFALFHTPAKDRLSPLERELLRTLWQHGSATGREIVNSGENRWAYTTMMAALDQMHSKGLVTRVMERRAFRYTPLLTEMAWERQAAQKRIRELLELDPAPMISYLVEALAEYDASLLDRLERLVAENQRACESK